jgi:hypothetical protein
VDLLVWTIAHGDNVARVCEDGTVGGDEALVAELRARLAQSITVYTRGTVAAGAGATAIELTPDDRRYVVARIRTLCAEDPAFQIVDCDWR